MADIFISYAREHVQLTVDLAHGLEAAGYTTWWDTSLLPGDAFVPQRIRDEIEAAKAVIVIWAEHSVTSRWVHAEASEGYRLGKLLQVCDASLEPHKVPFPFTSDNVPPVGDRAKIFEALKRRNIAPSKAAPAAPVKARPAVKIEAPEMVVIPAGSFMMGSKGVQGDGSEHPRHKVMIPRAFAVGKYPVTFAEWDAAVASGGVSYRPSHWGRGRYPVNNVSWDHAQAHIKWLSGATGQPYRLLSEAEWEYACRAGTTTAHSFGGNVTQAEISPSITVANSVRLRIDKPA